MDVKHAFKLLELDETATLSEVKLAYRDLASVWHPDRHLHNPRLTSKALARMQELNKAVEVASKYLTSTADERPQQRNQEAACSEQTSCQECGHPLNAGQGGLCSSCLASKPGQQGQKTESTFHINYDLLAIARVLATGGLAAIFVGLVLLVVYGGIFSGHGSEESNRDISAGLGAPAGGQRELTKKFEVDHFNVYEQYELLQLQRDLAAIGYTVGPVDGIIGPLTLEAVNRLYSDFFALTPIAEPGDVLRFAGIHSQVAAVYGDWKEIACSGLLEEWMKQQTEHFQYVPAGDDPRRLIRLLDLFSFDRADPAALPLPATEVLYTAAGEEKGNELLISARTATGHQLIKVVDPTTGRVLQVAFVRSGQVLITSLPVGRYELRRVSGLQWYGKRFLFGADTVHCSGGREGWLEIQKAGRLHLELADCSQDEDRTHSPLSLFVF